MFEKEAKEYEKRKHYLYEDNDYCGDITDGIIQAYQNGAEFGYNKAKVEIEDSYRENLCNLELNLVSVTEQLEELEKENAELKNLKDVATLIKANNDTVITLMQLNNKLVSKSQQLTKAKELLKTLLLIADNKVSQLEFQLCVADTKQFLNSEGEK